MDEDYSKFLNQKVIVQIKLDEPNENGETLVEVEGRVEAVNAMAVLLKPKGRTQFDLIELDKIESVDFAPEPDKKLSAKSLKQVNYGNARQHLLDRHGYTLESANQTSEEQAYEYHTSLDHSQLGHNHDPKPAKKDEAASSEEEAA